MNRGTVVLTFGDVWSQLFEDSLSRQMAGISHLQVGKPTFQVTRKMIIDAGWKEGETLENLLTRLNSKSTQASELVWKLATLTAMADLLLLDTKILDTAIGQFLLMEAHHSRTPIWAVGVDDRLSPIAPAFIKGVVYPQNPDDLVKLSISERRA